MVRSCAAFNCTNKQGEKDKEGKDNVFHKERCQQQVTKFPNARFRKFGSLKEAWEFVRGVQSEDFRVKNAVTTSISSIPSVTAPSSVQANIPTTSKVPQSLSDTQSITSLQQRLTCLENRHEELARRMGFELQEVRTKFETLKGMVKPATISEENKEILDKLMQLETYFETSKIELKTEIQKLSVHINSLELDKKLLMPGIGETSSCEREYNFFEPKISHDTDDIVEIEGPQNEVVKYSIDLTTESQHVFHLDPEGYVIVYTDGACENNGRRGAKAGIGVWFGDNHSLNCSEPVQGRPTNNTAEIQAARRAIEVAKKAGVKNLLVKTDSKFLIRCITTWIHWWKTNNWTLSTGGPVKNKGDLIPLENSMIGINVKWKYVRGHRGIRGNEMADMLARNGALHYTGGNIPRRTGNVTFLSIGKVKKFGGTAGGALLSSRRRHLAQQ